MKKEDKILMVEEAVKQLSSAKMVVFTSFEGMDVASVTDLRKKCRSHSITYTVFKNTLTERALAGLHVKGLDGVLKGTTALAVGGDDPVLAAKVIHEFSATNDKLKIKGGLLGTQPLTALEVVQLAKLPSRQALLTHLVVSMNAPISQLASVLAGIIRQAATVLKAVEDKKSTS